MKDEYFVPRIMFLVGGIVELLLASNTFDLGGSFAMTGIGYFTSGMFFTIFMVLELQAREKILKLPEEAEAV